MKLRLSRHFSRKFSPMSTFPRDVRMSLHHSDPGGILHLIMNLVDDACSENQAKLNLFLQNECEAHLVFHVVVHSDTGEAFVEAIGTTVLPDKHKLFLNIFLHNYQLPDFFHHILKQNVPPVYRLKDLDVQLTSIIMPFFTRGREKAEYRLVAVPLSKHPFSVVVCLVQIPSCAVSKTVDKIQALVSEMYMFVWPTLQKSIVYEYERSLKEKCQKLLRVARRLYTKVSSLPCLVELAMVEARRLTRARACAALLIDLDDNQLVELFHFGFEEPVPPSLPPPEGEEEDVREEQSEKDEAQKKVDRRFSLAIGVSGHVVMMGTLQNVKNSSVEPLFHKDIDERPGFTTQNLLVFPIRDETGIIGVGQLFNKTGAPYFDSGDEEMALAFSTLCGVCVGHGLVYRRVEESYVRSGLAYEVMMYHLKVTDEEVEKVNKCPMRHSNPHLRDLDLNVMSLPLREFPCYVVHMFGHLGLIDKFKIKRDKLIRFILHVQKGYRDVPYHNWYHAFSAVQFAYAVICKWKLVLEEYLSDFQVLMFMIATLVHDMDHRGTASSLTMFGEPSLSTLYTSPGSVLERHHLSQAVCTLNTDGCDILSALSRQQYDNALATLRDLVLATDLNNYFKKYAECRAIAEDGYVKSSKVHCSALASLLMNAADLCDQLKDWGCVKRTAASLLTEYFSGEGHPCEPPRPVQIDQENVFIPDLQINFMTTVAMPLFTTLGLIIPAANRDGAMTKILEDHVERWDCSRSAFSEVSPSAGMSVLLSAELDALIATEEADRRRPAEEERPEQEQEEEN